MRTVGAFILIFLAVATALNPPVMTQAQTAPVTPAARASGDVTQVQPTRLTLHTEKGEIQVALPEGFKLLRVPPGSKDLKSAEPISVNDINQGDRAVVLGHLSDDQQTIQATRVVVMSKSDISSFHAAEVKEWQTRGIEGVVKAVDSDKAEITIAAPNHPPTPGNMTHPMILATTPKTVLLRYAPNSIQFSDAKPSSFAGIKIGDQLRAVGNRSDDGSHYAADKVVFGTFRNIGATIVSVDTQANSLTVKNLATNKQVLVHANADCKMHRLPEFVARMIARLSTGEAATTGTGQPQNGGNEPSAPPSPGNSGGEAGGMRRGVGNLSQALDTMPVVALTDLKRGEPIVIFSTEGTSPSEVTAIYILTGVEPILAALPKGGGEMNLGTWNLSLGGGATGSEGGP